MKPVRKLINLAKLPPVRARQPQASQGQARSVVFAPAHVAAKLVQAIKKHGIEQQPAARLAGAAFPARPTSHTTPPVPMHTASAPSGLRADDVFAKLAHIKKPNVAEVPVRIATLEELGQHIGFDDPVLQETLIAIMTNDNDETIIRDRAAKHLEGTDFVQNCLEAFQEHDIISGDFSNAYHNLRTLIEIRARGFDDGVDYLVQTFAGETSSPAQKIDVAELLVIGHYIGLFEELADSPQAYQTGVNLYAQIIADENVPDDFRLRALRQVSQYIKLIDHTCASALANHCETIYHSVDPETVFAVRLTEEVSQHSQAQAIQMLKKRLSDTQLTDSTRAFVLERLFVLNHTAALEAAAKVLALDSGQEDPDDQKTLEKKMNALILETGDQALFANWVRARDGAKAKRLWNQSSIGEA